MTKDRRQKKPNERRGTSVKVHLNASQESEKEKRVTTETSATKDNNEKRQRTHIKQIEMAE